MTTFDVKMEGMDRIVKGLEEAPTKTGEVLNEGLREIGGNLLPILKRHTPVGVGGRISLRNSTRFQVIWDGIGPVQWLQIRQGAKSKGGFFYGVAVRKGRRPGRMPPVSALVPWVEKKLGIASNQARGVAFIIARKIGRRGTKPNPYHVRALDEGWGMIQNVVAKMGGRIVRHLTGGAT